MCDDTDSTDSECGIRFKTDSTRHKAEARAVTSSTRTSDYSRRDDRRDRRRSLSRDRGGGREKQRDVRSPHRDDRRRSGESSRRRSRDRRSSRDDNRRKESSRLEKKRDTPRDYDKHSEDKRYSAPKDIIAKKSSPPSSTRGLSNSNTSLKSISPEKTTDFLGPALPPKHTNNSSPCETKTSSESVNKQSKDWSSDSMRPARDKPSNSRKSSTERLSESPPAQDLICGPALPPALLNRGSSASTTTSSQSSKKSSSNSPKERRILGPAVPDFIKKADYVPPNFPLTEDLSDSDDSADIVGPLPAGSEKSMKHLLELEERALQIKLGIIEAATNPNLNEQEREEWMLELPEIKAVGGTGLGPRQFRARDRPDFSDRTSWTDTPKEKVQKLKGPTTEELRREKERSERAQFIAQRDAEQEAMAKKHKKKHKRDESLLDQHQKKMKKKKALEKEKSGGKSERRPFSRDTDLQVNKFDEAQKKSVINKARLLDTRFSSGDSKYL